MIAKAQRRAFTLIEILIVLGIIVAVAAIFVPVVLNLSERNQVPKAASLLENALSIAKARAISERRPNGIRLIATADRLRTTTGGQGFAWFDEIQYIETPSDYVEHWVWGFASDATSVEQPWWSIRRGPIGPAAPSPGALPWGFDTIPVNAGPFNINVRVDSGTATQTRLLPRNRLLFSPITSNDWFGTPPFPKPYINPITGVPDNVLVSDRYRGQRLDFSFSGNTPATAQVGDSIEILGTGQVYTINGVSVGLVSVSPNGPSGVTVSVLELNRPLENDVLPSRNGRPNYRLIRQPRAVATLAAVKLPQDVVIDLTPSRVAFTGLASGDLDTSNAFFMSNVSTGINVSGITGLTMSGSPQQVAPLYVDIMFSPTGELLPTSQLFGNQVTGPFGGFNVGSSGLIAMWLHSRGDPNLWAARQATAAQGNADNQALVSINARTGFIGSYSMTPLALSTDPLLYVRTGKARISADTGQ